jgi:hypothetical protein
MIVPYDSWIQRVCPTPKRYLAQLVMRFGLKTGLDIGCGESSPLTPLRAHGFRSIGVDASSERIENAKRRDLHDDYYCADIRTFPLGSLPPLDVVVMSHVIEHLNREEALNLLRTVEQSARRLVYVETPRGFVEPGYYDGNVLQRHLSGWFPWDFEGRGYTVFGSGLGWRRGPQAGASILPELLIRWTERLCQRFVFRRPGWGSVIAAIRYQDEDGNIRRI